MHRLGPSTSSLEDVGSTTADLLWKRISRADICPGSSSLEAWRNARWIRARVRGRTVRVLPVLGYRKALLLHDVHHLVTGYSTSFRGELELAAWELRTGGCAWNGFFWVDRVLAVALGLLCCPRRIRAAWKSGRGQVNLYGRQPDDVLALDLEELRRLTGR